MNWKWSKSNNPEEIHTLICKSDSFHATKNSPAPSRKFETTVALIEKGEVQQLNIDGQIVCTFTLSANKWYEFNNVYDYNDKPIYLNRLAIDPLWLIKEPIIGIQCFSKVIEDAYLNSFKVIRAEVNPEITSVYKALMIYGFEENSRRIKLSGVPVSYMEKKLI